MKEDAWSLNEAPITEMAPLGSKQRPMVTNVTTIVPHHLLLFLYLHRIYVCYNSTDTSSMKPPGRTFVICEEFGNLS